MIPKHRIWMVSTVTLLSLYGLAAFCLKPGYATTIMGDVTDFLLITVATVLIIRNAVSNHTEIRAFWYLIAAGFALWAANSGSWLIFEVMLRKSVPDPFFGDVILFLHIVPLMAALAIRPDRVQPRKKFYSRTLNFLILLLWWMFLYAFVVFPCQYVIFNVTVYSRNFDLLYLSECSMLAVALAVLATRTRGYWRKIYWNLFLATGLYMWSSLTINEAITNGRYHTGSWYDLPLLASMCWFIFTALIGPQPADSSDSVAMPLGKWQTLSPRLAMASILSLPLLGFWSQFMQTDAPAEIKRFRMLLTLAAMLVLGVAGFLRQYLLDQELVRLLQSSRENYENLARLQTEIVQREKLASLGQLVAGAAHEINNPLAAILGYSELLTLNRDLSSTQVDMALKIGQQARRTRDLVSGLLSFAQQTAGEKNMVELGGLVERCLRMKILQLEAAGIQLTTDITNGLPPVHGNPTQLLQCCLEIIDNAIDAMSTMEGGVLSVSTRREANEIVIEFADTGTGVREPQRVFDPFYTTKPVGKGIGLGLSATYGVVQDHHGSISCQNREPRGAAFIMRFPISISFSSAKRLQTSAPSLLLPASPTIL